MPKAAIRVGQKIRFFRDGIKRVSTVFDE